MAKKKIRIVNRQGAVELLIGLVGGPLAVLLIACAWLFSPFEWTTGYEWVVLAILSVCLPMFAAYGIYRALVICTLWIEVGSRVRVRKLLGTKTYDRAEIGYFAFESEQIWMTGQVVNVAVGKEGHLAVRDHEGDLLGRVRITAAERNRFIRYLQDHGGMELLAQPE